MLEAGSLHPVLTELVEKDCLPTPWSPRYEDLEIDLLHFLREGIFVRDLCLVARNVVFRVSETTMSELIISCEAPVGYKSKCDITRAIKPRPKPVVHWDVWCPFVDVAKLFVKV